MRAAGIAVIVGSAIAVASPATPPTTWADWVGDYRGALAWSNCTTAGAARATLALDAIDGAMSIDLAPAGRELRRMALVAEANGAWSARDGDLAVTIHRPQPRRGATSRSIALVVAYDSGCTLRATLSRASTGVADCDRLLGWARIASRCTKRDADPIELQTTWRATDAPRCRGRSSALELAMIDAGCAPHPDGALGVRGVDCGTLAAARDALQRCGAVPPPVKEPILARARSVVAASRTADRATLQVVERQCRDVAADIAALARRHRCP